MGYSRNGVSVSTKIFWDGVEQMLMNDPAVKKAVRQRAEAIAATARAIAPDDHSKSGNVYRESIRVDDGVTTGMRMNRSESRVTAPVPWATPIEAKHGTLARALGA